MSALQKIADNAAFVGQLRHQADQLQRAGLTVFSHRTAEAADLIERLNRIEAAAQKIEAMTRADTVSPCAFAEAWRDVRATLKPAPFAKAEGRPS